MEHLHFSERSRIARTSKNPNTLKTLATDEEWFVRSYVAENPNTPLEVLKILANDEDSIVREYVLENKNTTELIRRLVLMNGIENFYCY